MGKLSGFSRGRISRTAVESDFAREASEIDWNAYAPQFDQLANLTPAYRENMLSLLELVRSSRLDDASHVLDLGAGTGNYILALSDILPNARYFHVDYNPVMNVIAKNKYAANGVRKVTIIQDYIQRVHFLDESMDLIVCVNSLYSSSPQVPTLNRIFRWLKPGGIFFIIDFGRKQNIIDWGLHFLKIALRGRNIGDYFRFLLHGQQITRQAMAGRRAQIDGSYWLHSTEEFGSLLEKTGFSVEELKVCYRDYADLAVCKKGEFTP